jgi:hypothetical protein
MSFDVKSKLFFSIARRGGRFTLARCETAYGVKQRPAQALAALRSTVEAWATSGDKEVGPIWIANG